MNDAYIDKINKEHEATFTENRKKESAPDLNESIISINDKKELVERLQKEIEEEIEAVQTVKCGHPELVMKTRTASATSYPNKDGHWKTVAGDCPTCGKHFWDEFKMDDEYYNFWNIDWY